MSKLLSKFLKPRHNHRMSRSIKIDTKDKQVVEVPKEKPQKLHSKDSNQPKSTKSKNAKIKKQNFYLKAALPNKIWKKVQKVAKTYRR